MTVSEEQLQYERKNYCKKNTLFQSMPLEAG